MRQLNILHVPDLVGGNAPGLARAERELGLASSCVAFVPSPFGYAADEILRPPGVGRATFERRRLQLLWRALTKADVVHFNFGRSILPHPLALRELPLLRAAGKAIVVMAADHVIRDTSAFCKTIETGGAPNDPARLVAPGADVDV